MDGVCFVGVIMAGKCRRAAALLPPLGDLLQRRLSPLSVITSFLIFFSCQDRVAFPSLKSCGVNDGLFVRSLVVKLMPGVLHFPGWQRCVSMLGRWLFVHQATCHLSFLSVISITPFVEINPVEVCLSVLDMHSTKSQLQPAAQNPFVPCHVYSRGQFTHCDWVI